MENDDGILVGKPFHAHRQRKRARMLEAQRRWEDKGGPRDALRGVDP